MPERYGRCLGCGGVTINQSYCDTCEDAVEPEIDKIWCSVCFDESEGLTGGICKYCHEEAHTDNICQTGCPECDKKRLEVDCNG